MSRPYAFRGPLDLSGRYQATYRSQPKNVAIARAAIANFARSCGFDCDDVAEIELAVGEALANAAEHGSGRRGGSFTVMCRFTDEALVVDVRDTGRGFQPSTREPEALPSRGFGITIMRALMNEITFSENGSVVRLVRRRPQFLQDGNQQH